MPRWLRWIGYGLATAVALLALAVIAVYVVTGRRFAERHEIAGRPIPAATDSAALARGRHLADAVGKCAECHGEDLGGKVMNDDFVFGRLVGANITAGRGGLRGWSDADWERAIRHGVSRDGRPLFFMPAEAFQTMGDADLAALVAYLRTVPPVDREVPAFRAGPMARALYLGGAFPLLPVEQVRHDSVGGDAPPAGQTPEYGRYLAAIGGCTSCHGADLRGTGDPAAPAITDAKHASWSEADFFTALRRGTRPDGTTIDPNKMPWVASGRMTDDEIRAVWAYIRSVPPMETASR